MKTITVRNQKEYTEKTEGLKHTRIEDRVGRCLDCGEDRSVSYWTNDSEEFVKIIYASCGH